MTPEEIARIKDGRTRRRLINAVLRQGVYEIKITECLQREGMVHSYKHLLSITGGNAQYTSDAWRALISRGIIVKGIVGWVLSTSDLAKSKNQGQGHL
jgi:hypothetical protein